MTTRPQPATGEPPEPASEAGRADAGRRAEARSILAAIDRAILGGNRVSTAAHRIRYLAALDGLFGDD